MNILKAWRRWLVRDKTFDSLSESYLVLLKSARRCAHDLDHSVYWIKDTSGIYEMMQIRAKFWLKIFSPTGIKDYRLSLHEEIDELESKVDRLESLLKEHGIPFESKEPF